MDKNIRIFHSAFIIGGFSRSENSIAREGNCTFACRRINDQWLDVAVSFCHSNDVFRKKDGVRTALDHLANGRFITIPVGRNVSGKDLNDVIRSYLNRDRADDFRHICFGTLSTLPLRNWSYIRFFRREPTPVPVLHW